MTPTPNHHADALSAFIRHALQPFPPLRVPALPHTVLRKFAGIRTAEPSITVVIEVMEPPAS